MSDITTYVGTVFSTQQYAMNSALGATDDKISSLNEEKSAVLDVMNEMTIRLNAIIDGRAFDEQKGVYKYGGYGTTTLRSPSAWNIENLIEYTILTNIEYVSSTQFNTNITGTSPTIGEIIWCDNTDYYSRCSVVNVSGGTLKTITVSSANLYNNELVTSNIQKVRRIISEGGIYTGEDITKIQDDFDFAYNHIHETPNVTAGIYGGIDSKISAIESAKPVLEAMQTKQNDIMNIYKPYTSWTPAVTSSPVSYINEMSFSYPEDVTSIFPSGTSLLVDCGGDGQRGCKVKTVEYIPPSASDYTEITIIMDIVPYMQSPSTSALELTAMQITFDDGFVSVTSSPENVITSASWVDPVTFHCSGDVTSTVTSGASGGTTATQIIVTYNGTTLPTRYFRTYHSTHLSNPNAGCTVITISDGLPITSSISEVNKST